MRETKTFTTALGTVIEIQSYITGRETREIQNIFLEGMKLQMDMEGKPKANEIDVSLAGKAQDKAIELLIVSVNGNRENILNTVLDLPNQDLVEIVAEMDKVQGGLSVEKKTK